MPSLTPMLAVEAGSTLAVLMIGLLVFCVCYERHVAWRR